MKLDFRGPSRIKNSDSDSKYSWESESEYESDPDSATLQQTALQLMVWCLLDITQRQQGLAMCLVQAWHKNVLIGQSQ